MNIGKSGRRGMAQRETSLVPSVTTRVRDPELTESKKEITFMKVPSYVCIQAVAPRNP